MTQNALVATNLTPGSDLAAYVLTVNAIPVLSSSEEQELAERWRQARDTKAAGELVKAHLRYVVYIAKQYYGYGLPESDLIQEGNVGLMKAVRSFDPDRGVRLVTYAVQWIKSEIFEYIIRNWRIVRVATTKAQRKLFFKLRSYKKGLNLLTHDEREKIAADLGVKPGEVAEMETRLGAMDSEVASVAQEMSDDLPTQMVVLEDKDSDPESLLIEEERNDAMTEGLDEALSSLDERARDIVESRWLPTSGKKATLHDLAAKYDISAERVRQLEQSAMQRMRELLAPVVRAY